MKWLDDWLGITALKGQIETLTAKVKAQDDILYQVSKDKLELATDKIALQSQNADLQHDVSVLNGAVESLKTELAVQGVEVPSVKPTFLGSTGNVYRPNIQVEGEDISVTCPPDIYTRSNLLAKKVDVSSLKSLPKYKKVVKVWEYVINALVRYTGDKQDNWQIHPISILRATGDCLPLSTEIYTRSGVTTIGTLKVGDEVMSYDFEKKEYCFRPVAKIWEKGNLQVNRVHLRNGQYVDVSEKHPMWARTNQKGCSIYEKTYLSDVDLTRWWKRKLPISKKLPYEIKDIEWLTEDHCFIIGHFVAEGSVSCGKVETSGYACIDEIIPRLEGLGIPFSEHRNNSGVPVVRFLKGSFKEYLKIFLTDSFDIHLPEELFHLPQNKLNAFLDGAKLGDGHAPINIPASQRDWCYSTSSKQFADDLQRIGLELGEPLHIWKQEDHQGVGKRPIYRITHNPNSAFMHCFGYPNLSEVSISEIEKLGEVPMRDFEVEGTHTFIFKNGLIGHQCEDGTILFLDACRMVGISAAEAFNDVGNTSFGYHSYPIVKFSADEIVGTPIETTGAGWYIFETTIDFVPTKPKKLNGSEYWSEGGLQNWLYYGSIKPEHYGEFNNVKMPTATGGYNKNQRIDNSKLDREGMKKYWRDDFVCQQK